MKYIIIKVFEFNNEFAINLIVEKIKSSQRMVEKDLFKTFPSSILLKQYLNNIPINLEYHKSKIFIDYINDKILIENIIPEITAGLKKDILKDKVNLIYPNYNLKYQTSLKEFNLKNKKKQSTITLIPNELQHRLNEYFNCVQCNNKVYGYDLMLFQAYLNKKTYLFSNKYLLLIQKNHIIWRFFEILNGVIINYLIINEEKNYFDDVLAHILVNIEKTYDEIIIDADYKTYIGFNEKFPLANIVYIDFISKLKNIDERKIMYAKSKI